MRLDGDKNGVEIDDADVHAYFPEYRDILDILVHRSNHPLTGRPDAMAQDRPEDFRRDENAQKHAQTKRHVGCNKP